MHSYGAAALSRSYFPPCCLSGASSAITYRPPPTPWQGPAASGLTQDLGQPLPLPGVEPGRLTRRRIFGGAAGRLCRGQHAADALVAGDPFENGLGQGLNAEFAQEAGLNRPIEDPETKRTVDQDAQPEFGGQRQDPPFSMDCRAAGSCQAGRFASPRPAPRRRRGRSGWRRRQGPSPPSSTLRSAGAGPAS